MSTCRSCKALIRWVKLPSGKSMPIDAEPHVEGNVAVHSDGVRALVLTKEQLEQYRGEAPLYRSHFATCPQARQHRKE